MIDTNNIEIKETPLINLVVISSFNCINNDDDDDDDENTSKNASSG